MSKASDFCSLQDDLRAAMAVELTTMPPYLYAYWSIVPPEDGGSRAGAKAARIIMSVIVEEMLHMGLGANVLNALGGAPAITERPYVPSFPGPLLMHSTGAHGFDVALCPLSPATLDTFLQIELPMWDVSNPPPDGWTTIGQFYETIEQKIRHYEGSFDRGKQLPEYDNPGVGKLIQVHRRQDALAALDLIVHQGEGTSSANHEDGEHELAHYWRFTAVKEMIEDGTLDLQQAVYPVVDNPNGAAADYSGDQKRANSQFNAVYSALLDRLQAALTSDQPDVFASLSASATDYMDALGQLAAVLRATGTIPGTETLPGPTFDYIQPADR